MKKQTPLVEENKKRAAFKRFSQIGVTGLAVVSMSAFTNLSANELPNNVEKDVITEQYLPPINVLDESLVMEEIIYGDGGYNNQYSNYYNTYTNYSNANYSNNYSNQC